MFDEGLREKFIFCTDVRTPIVVSLYFVLLLREVLGARTHEHTGTYAHTDTHANAPPQPNWIEELKTDVDEALIPNYLGRCVHPVVPVP